MPGALTAGDLADLAASLAPRPLRLEALVDQLNRPVPATEMKISCLKIRYRLMAGNTSTGTSLISESDTVPGLISTTLI